MLIITTQNPAFGRGYFIGFDKDSNAHFQSCLDHRVKRYKTARGAEKQIDRITASLDDADDVGTFAAEPEPTT